MCVVVVDPPAAPGKPEIVDYDKNYVSLKWTAPKNDGGSPVKNYIIEKKPKYGDWDKVRKELTIFTLLIIKQYLIV